ncbi:unnamed protein product [Adineta ricciae]|uniref:Uncharacterized protein n=1 Tax=Adineta ricciae TaxID=249248 RepID=A0A813SWV6_ADIRI|nr:unnamed protein product [Adineta ricciae]CAF0817970.1 unnamed protein product [Adineta ricciae]
MSSDGMNVDDDVDQRTESEIESRDLIYQSLERDGSIMRFKAQLRAAIFKIVEKASNSSDETPRSKHEDNISRVCNGILVDWLEYSRLFYTQDVFKAETSDPNYLPPLTHGELLEELHLDANENQSQPILYALLSRNNNEIRSALPDHIKQSIEKKFPGDVINEINHVREHFRSLFSPPFDAKVLDAFLDKHLPFSLTSVKKINYEHICLTWMQACAQILVSKPSFRKQISLDTQARPLSIRNGMNSDQTIARARRATFPLSVSYAENP